MNGNVTLPQRERPLFIYCLNTSQSCNHKNFCLSRREDGRLFLLVLKSFGSIYEEVYFPFKQEVSCGQLCCKIEYGESDNE